MWEGRGLASGWFGCACGCGTMGVVGGEGEYARLKGKSTQGRTRFDFNHSFQTINTRIPCSPIYTEKQEPPAHTHFNETLLPRLEPYPMLKSMTRHMLSSRRKSLGFGNNICFFLRFKEREYAQPRVSACLFFISPFEMGYKKI